MKEQILSALATKFPGANANILDRIAAMLAKTVTTDEQVATAVEGVTKELIELVESYGDSRATNAQRTAVANYENKHGLKNGKKVEKPAEEDTTTADGGEDPTTNKLLQQLIEQNRKLTERLDRMDGERTTASRKAELNGIIQRLPENQRKGYQRIYVDNLSDEEFTTLKAEVTTEVEELVKEVGARRAVFGRPSNDGGKGIGNGKNEATDAEVTAVVDKLNV